MIELIQQILNGLVVGSVYTLIALGLTIIFGILGIAHFAHGSVAMFGGYLTYVLMQALGVHLLVAMPLAMVAGAVLGVVIERVAYHPVRNDPPINAFIIALGLTMVIEKLNLLMFGPDQVIVQSPFGDVFEFGEIVVPELRAYVFLIAVVLVVAMTLFINKSWMGSAIRAVAQNRPAAVLMGVNVNRVSMIVFALSSALAVAAGALVGALFAVAPGVSGGLVIKGFAVLILGGLGSIPGAIVGGLILGISESLSAGFLSSGYKDVISFVIMIGVLLLRPEGLMRKKG